MSTVSSPRIAARMRTIGTESAFEVSARARALEAQGHSIIHLQIGEPDFDTPANVRAAAKRALDEGATHYAPFAGIPALREAIAADVGDPQGPRRRPVPGLRHGRRQGRDAVRDPRADRSRGRGHRPGSRLPDLRVPHPVRRRDAGPDPDPHGPRVPARRRRARVAHHAQDPDAGHQLAGQPDRRRPDARRPRADRRAREPPRPVDPRRRDLCADPVRRRGARVDRVAARDGRADDRARRVLEDLRDDRLAAGLRGRAAVARPDLQPAHHQHDQLRPDVRPGRGGRGADRATGRRRCDGRRVQGPARPRRRGAQRHRGHPMRDADRRVLRLPRRLWHGTRRRDPRRTPPPRGRRMRAGRAPRSGASGPVTSGSATRTRART